MEGLQGVPQESKPNILKQGRDLRETGGENRKRIVPCSGPGLYRGGRETRKRPAKTIVREKKELK